MSRHVYLVLTVEENLCEFVPRLITEPDDQDGHHHALTSAKQACQLRASKHLDRVLIYKVPLGTELTYSEVYRKNHDRILVFEAIKVDRVWHKKFRSKRFEQITSHHSRHH